LIRDPSFLLHRPWEGGFRIKPGMTGEGQGAGTG
jgi:hypothetical protein